MAYLFGVSTTDIIDCGTGVTKADEFTLWLRCAATSVSAVDRRICYLERASDGHRNAGLAFNDGASNNELLGNYRETGGGTFPSVSFVSGWTAGAIHTVAVRRNAPNLDLFVDGSAVANSAGAANSPDQEADLGFRIGNLRPGLSLSADCTIYEVGWWTLALTDPQILAMHSGTPPGANLPSSYWPLINNALDLFGGAHGTVTGATVVAHAGTNLYTAAPRRRSLTLLGVGS